jgi:hypothetical protein
MTVPRPDGAAPQTADATPSSSPDVGNSVPESHTDVPTTQAIIAFQFKNVGSPTLYVYGACTVPFVVTSISDGKTYGNSYACACDCASSSCTNGLQCGQCLPPTGYGIARDMIKEVQWVAQSTTSQTKTGPDGPFPCVSLSPIPVGSYKVAIVVYTSEADAVAQRDGHVVERVFVLGPTNATVEVPIE